MDWKDIGRSLISQGAPMLGGLLGGPAGAVAGKLLAGTFGADPENPEEVMNAIQGDPDAILKIRELEMTHKQKLQELQLDETKAFLNDINSARQRESAIATATGKQDKHLYILTYIYVGSFFVLILGVILGEFGVFGSKATETFKDSPLIMMIVGALISGVTQIISYFFGSSKGSSEKNKMLTPKG
ncbi:MAG: hypothetical protein ACI93R_002216 [Flavobacteriales bacterium]|jgi:hypothetical protein